MCQDRVSSILPAELRRGVPWWKSKALSIEVPEHHQGLLLRLYDQGRATLARVPQGLVP